MNSPPPSQPPPGDEYEKALNKFKKKHSRDLELIQEVDTLLSLLQYWDFRVFWNINEHQAQQKIEEVIEKLDNR